MKVQLSWLEPAYPNGDITEYGIAYSYGSNNVTTAAKSTKYTISGHSPGSILYNITVTPNTRVGPGPSMSIPIITTHGMCKYGGVVYSCNLLKNRGDENNGGI